MFKNFGTHNMRGLFAGEKKKPNQNGVFFSTWMAPFRFLMMNQITDHGWWFRTFQVVFSMDFSKLLYANLLIYVNLHIQIRWCNFDVAYNDCNWNFWHFWRIVKPERESCFVNIRKGLFDVKICYGFFNFQNFFSNFCTSDHSLREKHSYVPK